MPVLPAKQDNLYVKFECEAQRDWVVRTATIEEEVSQSFRIDVSLYTSNDIVLANLLNKEAKLSIVYGSDSCKRYFHGVIASCSFEFLKNIRENIKIIHVQIVHPIFKLSLSTRYRVFQKKSAVDIIDTVFKENFITNVKKNLTSAGKSIRGYCSQYGETDFYFISRLMEEEGIFYFFEYSETSTALILSDKSSSAKKVRTDFAVMSAYSDGIPKVDEVYECYFTESLRIKSVESGAFNYEKFKTIRGKAEDVAKASANIGIVENYESHFMEVSEGEKVSKILLESTNCFSSTFRCKSQNPTIAAGIIISVKDNAFAELNDVFLVTKIKHVINQAEAGLFYENYIECINANVPFRAPFLHPKKRVSGFHPGVVVGPEGEEINVDELGRTEVVPFYPSAKSAESSVWARVTQIWAGQKRGTVITPRIGDEVELGYVNGDPDHPVVKGSLYNGINTPPANYPKDRKTALSLYTKSSKGGDEKLYNEIRLDDFKDREEIFIHAQKDMNTIIEDSVTEVLNYGCKNLVLNSQKEKVSNNITIKKGDNVTTINEGDYMIAIDRGNSIITLNDGNQSLTLQKGNLTINVKGDISISAENIKFMANKDVSWEVNGSYKKSVARDIFVSSQNMELSTKQNYTLSAGLKMSLSAKQDASLKAMMNMSVEGNLALNAKGGTTAKLEGGAAVTVRSGAVATLEGGASASVKGGGSVSIAAAMISLG
jgi:type VI secretion system secreted protein VgrG